MKQALYFFAIALLMFSCAEKGYKKTKSGLQYKLIALGDETKPVNTDNRIECSIHLTDDEGNTYDLKYYSPLHFDSLLKHVKAKSGGLQELISLLHEGDSALFICDKKSFWMEPLGWQAQIPDSIQTLNGNIKIIKIWTEDSLHQYNTYLAWLSDMEMEEHKILNKFLAEQQFDESEFYNGIYYREVLKGEGRKPKSGDVLKIHYRAWLINGTPVDNTYAINFPLEITLGEPDQLLKGFDIGIRNMQQSGEAVFVIPSLLAFGEKGSTEGIVPPFSTIIYEVKLLKVN